MQRSGTVAEGQKSKSIAARPPLNTRQCTFPSTRQNAAKPSPLGISINTNFQQASKAPPKQIFPDKTGTTHGLLTHSSQATVSKKAKPSLTLGKEVSPWDREIPICISPQTLGGTPALTGDRRLSYAPSKTPLIVVTPIEEDFGCSSPLPRVQDIYRTRIASSVYSPPSRNGRRRSHASRPASATTIFEEDGASSAGSSRKLKRFSLDSVVPTPRRSVGWWNLITSPTPRRSSTSSSGRSAKDRNDEEQTPLLEDAVHAAATDDQQRGMFDDPQTRREIEESPFFDYSVPKTGEAAKYYDTRFVFDVHPFLGLSSDIYSSPDIDSASRAQDEDSPRSLHSEGYALNSPIEDQSKVQTLAKKVSTPIAPASTPPKSSVAAVMDRFKTPPPEPARSNTVASRGPMDKAASTRASSPEISTANVQRFQYVTMPDMPDSPATNKMVSTPPAGAASATPRDHFGTPAHYTPGYATVTRDDSNQAPPLHQPLPRVVLDPAATPEFCPAPASQPSTRPHSAYGSTRHLASPFETPAPYHASGADRNLVSGDYHEKPSSIEPLRGAHQRRPTRSIACCGPWGRQRWLLFVIASSLVLIVLLAVILAMKLTANHSSISVEAAWLNLTGYPPLPTGISTVAGVRVLDSESGCIDTQSMWSCALPKEEQYQAPNSGSSPNFRIEILFNRDAVENTSLLQRTQAVPLARRDHLTLEKRGPFERTLFTPYPSVPSESDQHFLGNNTNGNAEPYNGIKTPFYMSILPTSNPSDDTGKMSLHRRAIVPSNASDATSDTSSKIPQPVLLPNGTAPPATLHPYPTAQPLRLFNQGTDEEYFGFYTYFSRSIFLSSAFVDAANGTSTTSRLESRGDVNTNGGAPVAQADTICTWSQTRFLIQIWTRSSTPPSSSSTLRRRDLDSSTSNNDDTATTNSTASALDFSGSGTFPYPMTITLDRHGGHPKDKGVYCYGLDGDGRVITQQKALHAEDRGYGGSIVNPALGAFTEMDGMDGYRGFDGGDGGCRCKWGSRV